MTLGSVRPTTEVGLVGRERELAELWGALDGAIRGRGGVWLVGGEPGIGKTALLEAVAEAAGPTEVQVLWGRCWEGGGAPAYWPWIQVVRAAVARMGDEALTNRLGAGAGDVAALVPELAARVEGLAPAPAPDTPGARFRLFDAVTRFLLRTAAEAPLLVALDDLHAADEASLLLLAFVAGELARNPVAVVGTHRDAEVRGSPRLTELLAGVARHGRRLTLAGLDHAGVEALFEAGTGAPASPGLVTRVLEATEGNPFLVKEMARLLAARGGPPAAGARLPLPEEAHAIVARHLAPLPQTVREVLSAAAVLGRDFDLSALAALTRREPVELLDVLADARRRAVVDEGRAGRWSFSHALLREVLYDQLAPSGRVHLHRRAAEALGARPGPDGALVVAAVAHHRYEAARGGRDAGAADACAAAGAQASQSLAFEDAAAWYERALEVADLAAAGTAGRLPYDLLVAAGQARFRAGQFADARGAYRRAVEIARELGDPELLAEAALGFYGLRRVSPESMAFLHEALTGLPEGDSALRARLLVSLGGGQLYTRPEEWQRWATMCDEAVAMARRVGDPDALLVVSMHWHACQPLWDPLGVEHRRSVAEEVLALCSASGRAEWRTMARYWRFCSLLSRGEIPAAREEAAAAVVEAQPLMLDLAMVDLMRATLAFLAGDLEGAEAHVHRLLRPDRASLDELGTLSVFIVAIRWEQGRFEEAADLLQEAVSSGPPRFGITAADIAGRALETWAESRRGGVGAPHAFDSLVADALAWKGSPHDPSCVAGLAQSCWLLGDHRRAGPLYDLARPYAGWLLTWDILLPVPLGAADHHLGLLAALAGRYDEADAHFQAAHALHRRLRAPILLAHGQADHARMLLLRDGAGDRARAAALATEAAEAFRALGMSYYEEETRKLVHEGALLGEASSPVTAERGVLRRQGEYWSVSYGGREVRLRHAKGLGYLVRLLAEPGRELHVLDLAGEGSTRERVAVGGDAGAVLDATAKAAYRRRLAELEVEADEADAACDLARAEKVAAERDFLIAELAAAVGLGGRDRVAASAAERARQSVTRAVRGTVARLAEAHPELGRHLETTVRTGVYCAYSPDPRVPITWEVS